MMNTTRVRATNAQPLRFLTIMSGVAIVLVVLIHVRITYYRLTYFDGVPFLALDTPDRIVEVLIRYAVPMFVFIAGFRFQFSSAKSYASERGFRFVDYLRARFKRLVVPYVLWSAIYLVLEFGIFLFRLSQREPAAFLTEKQIIGLFIGYGHPAYQLWYIPMLLFASLTVIWTNFVIRKRWVMWLLYAAWLAATVFAPAQLSLLMPLNLWLPYCVVFEAGMWCARRYAANGFVPNAWLAAAGWAALGTARVLLDDLTIDPLIDVTLYVVMPLALYSVVATLVPQRNDAPLKRNPIDRLGELSWPIYLLHAPFLLTVLDWGMQRVGLTSPWLQVPFAVVIIALSVMGYWLITRISKPLALFLFGELPGLTKAPSTVAAANARRNSQHTPAVQDFKR